MCCNSCNVGVNDIVFTCTNSPILLLLIWYLAPTLRWYVQNSVVKSIAMDGWSHPQIISMLEGGNDQLSGFFLRHSLSPKSVTTTAGSNSNGNGSGNSSGDEQDSDIIVAKAAAAAAKAAAALQANQKPKAPSRSNSFNTVDEIVALRYKTKAALFYRENLAKHVDRVAADVYKGREAARKRATGSSSKSGGTSPSNERKSKSAKAGSPSPHPSPRAGLPPVSAASAVANGAR